MKYRNFYSTLGVESTADSSEIKNAYIKTFRRIEESGSPNTRQQLLQLNGIYHILGYSRARFFYDQLLSEGKNPSPEDVLNYMASGPVTVNRLHSFTGAFSTDDSPWEQVLKLYIASQSLGDQNSRNSTRDESYAANKNPNDPLRSGSQSKSLDATVNQDSLVKNMPNPGNNSERSPIIDKIRGYADSAQAKFSYYLKHAYSIIRREEYKKSLSRLDELVSDAIGNQYPSLFDERINQVTQFLEANPDLLRHSKPIRRLYDLTSHLISKAIKARNERMNSSESYYFDTFTSLINRTNLWSDPKIAAQVNGYLESIAQSASRAINGGHNNLLQSDLKLFVSLTRQYGFGRNAQRNSDALLLQLGEKINATRTNGFRYSAEELQRIRDEFKKDLGFEDKSQERSLVK